jgi:hypothetical protein
MIRRLIILLLIVGLFSQDSTFAVQINDKNGILYLKDGTSLECVHTLSWTDGFGLESGFPKYFLLVKCDEELFDVNLVEEMVSKYGKTTTGKELIIKKKERNFWTYTITAGVIVLLVFITT